MPLSRSTCGSMPLFVAPLLLCGSLCCAVPAFAHTGPVAAAAPLSGITIDGDLSDWPARMTSYPLYERQFGDAPSGPEDLQAAFRVGYGSADDVLYLAVEVRDQSAVVDTARAQPEGSQDGCAVYLDPEHVVRARADDPFWPGSALYVVGDSAAAGVTRGAGYQVGLRRSAPLRTYEWRIDVGAQSGGRAHLEPGRLLGLDIVAVDRDSDGSLTEVAWETQCPSPLLPWLGDLALLAPGQPTGSLLGQVRWQGQQAGAPHVRVRLRSAADPHLSLQAGTDAHGQLAAVLPAGTWEARAPGVTRTVEVVAAQEARLDLELPPPRGRTVPAGPGTVTLTGAGRAGAWRSFGVADGLPAASVGAMLQDRQGRLWLGTGRIYWDREVGSGAVCYDGARAIAYTAADGLADNTVTCMAQDRDGSLWFGTAGGISRYDGRSFTTFTSADGLADDGILGLLCDTYGNVWCSTFAGVSRYDGHRFTTFTAEDGLGNSTVFPMVQDSRGDVWLGKAGGGASRWDGQRFSSLTCGDGLPRGLMDGFVCAPGMARSDMTGAKPAPVAGNR